MKKKSSKKTSSKIVKNGASKRAKTPARAGSKAKSKDSLALRSPINTKSKKDLSKKRAKSGRNTQFSEEQKISKNDMDIAIDEPVVGPHEMRTHEEEHSPRKYHRAEDIEEHKKDASRKPKGQAKDAPQARRENQNTHRRG